MSRIVTLQAENVKKLKSVRINAEGKALLQIRGKNGQGKSSTLDSIAYALGGKRVHPPELIRVGQTYARVVLETDLLTIERKWWKTDAGDVESEVFVRSKDGAAQFRSPQTMLDALTSRYWDPIAWTQLPAAKQAEVLREIIGVDFRLLDAKRKEAYDARTDANREVLGLKKRLEAMPVFPVKPEPVDVTALLAERATNGKAVRDHESKRDALARKVLEEGEATHRASLAVKAAEAALNAAYAAQAKAAEAWDAARLEADAYMKVEAPVDRAAELDAKISSATAANLTAERYVERLKLEAEAKAAEELSGKWSSVIEDVDRQKSDAVKQANFPVPGLGFGVDGVMLNGLPLVQASQAEQIALSVAIGFALNPELRVLIIRNGSLIDPERIALLEELAEKHDGQIIMERNGTEGVGVLIVDGEVASITEADGTVTSGAPA